MTSLQIPSVTIVRTTAATPPYTATGPGGTGVVNVPFCRVEGTVKTSPNAEVSFDVWLPDNWVGRMKTEATGGYAGGAPYARMAQQIPMGFAEVGSNMGHNGGQAPSWDFGNPESLTTYGYGAHQAVATAAKAIINAYYGAPVKYAYFDGCSNGGRQAHLVAQRYPDLYNGFLIGAPSNYYAQVMLYLMWHQQQLKPQSSSQAALLSPAKLNLIATSVMNACDARDAQSDQLIQDPRVCKFDINTIACSANATDTSACLTPTEANVAKEIYKGPHDSKGNVYWMGAQPGAENNWNVAFGDNGGYGNFARDVVIQDPNWDWRTVNWDTQAPLIRDLINPFMWAPNPDYSALRARGVKIIQYHGWFDPVVTPTGSVNFYNAMLAWENNIKSAGDTTAAINNLTPQQVQTNILNAQNPPLDNFRLFMVPGMGHCTGGASPNAFDQPTTPGSRQDPDHDAVLALVKWVEQGVAPDKIVATEWVNNTPAQGIKRERPLCPYPKISIYKGSGDPNAADSYVCAMPPTTDQFLPTADDMMEIKLALNNRQKLATAVYPGAVEFYNAKLNQYFMTTSGAEIAALDAGTFAGWTKTGAWINAANPGAAGANPVCRLYQPATGQHLFITTPSECQGFARAHGEYQLETTAAFYEYAADASGNCPSGTQAVYELVNGPNYRFTTRTDVRDAMLKQGWTLVSTGSGSVAFCSPTTI